MKLVRLNFILELPMVKAKLPVDARNIVYTVALTDFSSRILHTKVHLKKNLEVEKLDGNR
jgi:hypothetical protein